MRKLLDWFVLRLQKWLDGSLPLLGPFGAGQHVVGPLARGLQNEVSRRGIAAGASVL